MQRTSAGFLKIYVIVKVDSVLNVAVKITVHTVILLTNFEHGWFTLSM
jgi:hypothetical protein